MNLNAGTFLRWIGVNRVLIMDTVELCGNDRNNRKCEMSVFTGAR